MDNVGHNGTSVALVAADRNGLTSKLEDVLATVRGHFSSILQLRRPFFKRSAHKLDNAS